MYELTILVVGGSSTKGSREYYENLKAFGKKQKQAGGISVFPRKLAMGIGEFNVL